MGEGDQGGGTTRDEPGLLGLIRHATGLDGSAGKGSFDGWLHARPGRAGAAPGSFRVISCQPAEYSRNKPILRATKLTITHR